MWQRRILAGLGSLLAVGAIVGCGEGKPASGKKLGSITNVTPAVIKANLPEEVVSKGAAHKTTTESFGAATVLQAAIANNAVGTNQIENSAVTAAKIASGTIEAADIKNATITEAKVKQGTECKFIPTGGANGEALLRKGTTECVWGKVSTEGVGTLGVESVETNNIKKENVTKEKLAPTVQNALVKEIAGENTGAGEGSFKEFVKNPEPTGFCCNTAFGWDTLSSTLAKVTAEENGAQNSAFGSAALKNNTNGAFNNAFGVDALEENTKGIENTATGEASLRKNTIGSYNSAYGNESFESLISGKFNTGAGVNSAKRIATGNSDAAFGIDALEGAVGSSASFDQAFGPNVLKRVTTAENDAGVGNSALENLTTGNGDTAVGEFAGQTLTTQSGDVFLGANAGRLLTGSNELCIANNETECLIQGSFASKIAEVHGELKFTSLPANSIVTSYIKNAAITEEKLSAPLITKIAEAKEAKEKAELSKGIAEGAAEVANERTLAVHAEISTETTLGVGQFTPVNTTAANVKEKLPTTGVNGTRIAVEKTDSTTHELIVEGNIRGVALATNKLTLEHETREFVSDASGHWWPLGAYYPRTGLESIFQAKLGSESIITSELAKESVTEEKIAPAAVGTSKIKNGAVTEEKLESTLAKRVTLPTSFEAKTVTTSPIKLNLEKAWNYEIKLETLSTAFVLELEKGLSGAGNYVNIVFVNVGGARKVTLPSIKWVGGEPSPLYEEASGKENKFKFYIPNGEVSKIYGE